MKTKNMMKPEDKERNSALASGHAGKAGTPATPVAMPWKKKTPDWVWAYPSFLPWGTLKG